MLLCYDGGPYKGWQPHPELPTVCGVLAAALHRAGVDATPFGASRTDAGVHARAQVASFTTHAELEVEKVQRALSADLPSTLQLLALREAGSSFHAHWSSIGKVYRYRISFRGGTGAWRLPFLRLDLPRLEQALAMLREAPDVSALAAPGEHGPATRRLDRATVLESSAGGVLLEFAAAGFGKHLVRHLVGAAAGFAAGTFDERALSQMIAGQVSRPPRAEADGLTLHQVLYPAELDPFPDVDLLAT